MARREYKLQDFVHRVLTLRLLACGTAIAVVLAAIAYVRGYEQISDVVMVTARLGIERTRVEVRRLLDPSASNLAIAIEQALSANTAQPPDNRYGQFVYARIADTTGKTLAERV